MAPKKILVAPLDWGLGHATRCIPVIHELLRAGHEVVIAADGRVEHLLREEFPGLPFVFMKGYGLSYSAFFPAWMTVIFQLPKILFRMAMEHVQLKKIIRENKIDVVISDSRFGLWSSKACSVYITHQVMIKCPGGLRIFEPLLYYFHQLLIGKYDHCWIPDHGGKTNISGDLSHKYPIPPNAHFINPLSRFTLSAEKEIFEYDICIVISGPEPSRSAFEKIVLNELSTYKGKAILIAGQPGRKYDEQKGAHRIVSHLPTNALKSAILSSRIVVCRSGYSSIMDLVTLKKDALLIPTPGQTEQEYLAAYLASHKIFKSASQSEFSISDTEKDAGYSVNNLGDYNDGKRLTDAIALLTDS
jgi:uncharacterized protein (TIGR00661 family)